MPRRPDQGYDPPYSALPAQSQSGVFRGRLVVIFGTGVNTGLFIYNGTPALGNPPILSITTASADPYGNPVTAQTISDAAMPLLVYRGTPAAGNLVVSVAAAGGSDIFGNSYIQGVTAYQSASIYANLLSGNLLLVSGLSSWSASADATASALGFFDNTNNDALFMSDGATGSGGLCVVGNQPGTTTTPETWHNLTLNAAVWTAAAGASTPRYRVEPVGSKGLVRLDGILQAAANNAANTAIATLPAGWRPPAAKSLPTVGALAAFGGVSVTSGGAITANAACGIGNSYSLDGVTFPLD
jgi:hypothetical protein